jgi:hypothetical protein
MKFSPNTVTQPVRGVEARRLTDALKSETGLTNPQYESVIEEIVQIYKAAQAEALKQRV